jgi:hypothetical protein
MFRKKAMPLAWFVNHAKSSPNRAGGTHELHITPKFNHHGIEVKKSYIPL